MAATESLVTDALSAGLYVAVAGVVEQARATVESWVDVTATSADLFAALMVLRAAIVELDTVTRPKPARNVV